MSDFNPDWFSTDTGQHYIIADIGGWNFSDSIALKKRFPRADVYAFEPDPRNLHLYAPNALANGVQVCPYALCEKDGTEIFYSSLTINDQPWTASGSLMKPLELKPDPEAKGSGLIFDRKGTEIGTLRLETFCVRMGIPRIDLIHMDVQGAEARVIEGLGSLRPSMIFCETCEFDTYYDTGMNLESFDGLMTSRGYKVSKRLQHDTLYVYSG